MEINAKMIKQLRDETGASMGECKKALEETAGNMEEAKKILRQKGAATAEKRAGRSATQGLIAVATRSGNQTAAVVDLRCETDFVARNEEFAELAQEIADFVADECNDDVSAASIMESILPKRKETIALAIQSAIGKIGEKIDLAKVVRYSVGDAIGIVDTYIHHDKKTGSLVQVNVDDENSKTDPELQKFAHELALQVVVNSPTYISRTEIPQSKIDDEISIEKTRAIEEGKKPDIAEKIAVGRVEKNFIQSACILEQAYWRDEKMTVNQLLAETEEKLKCKINVVRFARLSTSEDA